MIITIILKHAPYRSILQSFFFLGAEARAVGKVVKCGKKEPAEPVAWDTCDVARYAADHDERHVKKVGRCWFLCWVLACLSVYVPAGTWVSCQG